MAVAQWIERWVADSKDGGSRPSRHARSQVLQREGQPDKVGLFLTGRGVRAVDGARLENE